MSEAPTDAAAAAPIARRVTPYAWYVLGVLVIVYAFSLIDRQILSILAEDVKRDLDLTDTQLGFLYGTAFAVFYSVFGIPLGRLADSWRRTMLMVLSLSLWSAMTVMSGLAGSYAHLAIARVGVGIGEAGCSPAAYSMLASLFPKERRGFAIAVYSAGAYLGIGLSLPVGGLVAGAWNDAFAAAPAPFGLHGWQVAFMAVGVPGLLVAAWIATLREPKRYTESGAEAPVVQPHVWRNFFRDVASILPPFTLLSVARFKGELLKNVIGAVVIFGVAGALIWATGDVLQWAAYSIGVYAVFSWTQSLRHSDPPAHRLILGSPTIPLAVVGFGCVALIIQSFGFWAAPYAIRTFNVSAAEIGPWIGIPGAIGSAIGAIGGGRISDVWKARDPRGRIYTCMVSAALCIPLIAFMFTRSDVNSYLLISPFIFVCGSVYSGASVACYQELVLPRMSGVIGAIHLLGVTLVGLALGPYVSGKIATVTGSLQLGVFSILLWPVVAIVALWLLSLRAADDERTKFQRAIEAGEPA